jgi:hypothetical protein
LSSVFECIFSMFDFFFLAFSGFDQVVIMPPPMPDVPQGIPGSVIVKNIYDICLAIFDPNQHYGKIFVSLEEYEIFRRHIPTVFSLSQMSFSDLIFYDALLSQDVVFDMEYGCRLCEILYRAHVDAEFSHQLFKYMSANSRHPVVVHLIRLEDLVVFR